jgi:ribulose-phosphate 3-epimerase
MAVIVPTVLAENPHQYREQIERAGGVAKRIHLDFTDGLFAKSKTISLEQAWLPEGVVVDMHIMHQAPGIEVSTIIKLKPHLVIVHAEAEGSFVKLAEKLHAAGIKTGVALLPKTDPYDLRASIKHIDHVLIFSGDLGHFGGEADLKLLHKVKHLRHLKPDLEIGWDGGINDKNAEQLVAGGINVLNVGGYLQRAQDPKGAYDYLQNLLH